MNYINPHSVNEHLQLPGFETRKDRWYEVALSNGVLAVRAEFDTIEPTVIDGLDRGFCNGQTYGEVFDLKLIPGELTYDDITCMTDQRTQIYDLQTRHDEDVVFIAAAKRKFPYQEFGDFL